jgi:hypothetical protein
MLGDQKRSWNQVRMLVESVGGDIQRMAHCISICRPSSTAHWTKYYLTPAHGPHWLNILALVGFRDEAIKFKYADGDGEFKKCYTTVSPQYFPANYLTRRD